MSSSFAEQVAAADAAARQAVGALVEAQEFMAAALEQSNAGMTDVEVARSLLARGGTELRRTTADAINGYVSAAAHLRAVTIRVLIDEGSESAASIADRIGTSRQMVQRLYAAAGDGQLPGSDSGAGPPV